MAVVTVANLIPRVRRWLEDAPLEDYTTDQLTASSTTINLGVVAKWASGDVIEFPDGDQAKITQADPLANPVTIRRGYNDTTAAAHTGASTVLLKNPRFSYANMSEAITRLISNGLHWPYAWKSSSKSLTASSSPIWYDLDATARGIIEVTQPVSATDVAIYARRKSQLPVAFEPNLPTSLVASGVGVAFPGGLAHPTNTIYVTYAAELTTADITDGLMSDCVVWGACERLLAMKEVPRTGEDVSMGDSTVQPGAEMREAAYFHAKFIDARKALNTYLRRTIPLAS